ncbi:MAG TPA: DinB family protein [Acidimicrobiales bacterium]|nr:DinB family protein [Acidimicrobiales bacterium]
MGEGSAEHGPTDAHVEGVTIKGATVRDVVIEGADVRGSLLRRIRLRGTDIVDVDISGELHNVIVNGVDIVPLVEAELDRRTPERAKMRPDDSDGFREAWAILGRLWEGTLARARTFPPAALQEEVGDEWSFIQTLRHLNFASAAWVGRMALGDPSPWHPLDLPWDEAPGWQGIPWDRDARPTLDEVLVVRDRRRQVVGDFLAELSDERLASTVTRTEPGWPRAEDFPLKECLSIVLNEEWHHRLFAERDLSLLEPPATA